MGYTHFDKVSGKREVAIGAVGSEAKIADSSGIYNPGNSSAQIASSNGLFQDYVFVATGDTISAAATEVYVVSPVAGSVSGYCCSSASDGTGRTMTVTTGSAGDILLEAPAGGAYITSNGTVGIAVAMANTSGTTTIAAGQSMSIAFASCGTSQEQTCTVIVSRTA